jgi:hypothetical protein
LVIGANVVPNPSKICEPRGMRSARWSGWTFLLVVVGMNSIAMYVLVHIAGRR